MKIKILMLLAAFFVFLSFNGVSQTTETSKHPLLDKYYPQPKNVDTVKNIPPQSKTVIVNSQLPEKKPVAVISDTSTINKSAITPVKTTQPIPGTELVHESVLTDTTAINKSNNVAVPAPVQNSVHPRPAPQPYRGNRLGSSSRLYDTWEKNNNGAGSVTTRPKG